MIRIRTGHS